MEYIYAFLVGGAFCAVGQILIDKTRLTPARILVSYVCAGVFLTLLGVYEPLVKFAGAGATVPLTGFGYAIMNGVKAGIHRDGIFGILTGGMQAASAGITAAILAAFLASLVFHPRIK